MQQNACSTCAHHAEHATVNPYHLTVDELCQHGEISQIQVAAAVEAYLDGTYALPCPLGAAYSLNLAYAVRSHPFAAALARDYALDRQTRYDAVRLAILMARPMRQC